MESLIEVLLVLLLMFSFCSCHDLEPRMDSTACLEPFKDLEISKRICPLDIRLSIDQLVDIMRKHKHPKHVLVPSSGTTLTRSDGTAELADAKGTTSTPACQWSAYKYTEPLQLGIGSLYETVLLSEEASHDHVFLLQCARGQV